MRPLFLLVIIIFILGCKGKKTAEASKKSLPKYKIDSFEKISIKKVGELRFRMTYVVEGKTLNINQLKKIGQNKLDYYYAAKPDTILLKKFQELGLVTEMHELLLRRFKSFKTVDPDHFNAEFELKDSGLKKLDCKLIRNNGNSHYTLSVSDSLQSSQILIDGFYIEGLKFMFLDIISGGYKEIAILNNYYISNGDNSDIFIYEIKNAN